MRILITNDDGVNAPGLAVMERIARQLSDDVTVVAPETDQSGVAHSLSLSEPLRLRPIEEKRFAVRGTPTDCVILAVREIFRGARPDLVLSGVNRGQNVAEDVTYSGTVAGAMEGAILGIASIALSQAYTGVEQRMNPRWGCAETHAPGLVRRLYENMSPGDLINLNFPDCEAEYVRGVSVTSQGARGSQLFDIEGRTDGRGMNYYWVAIRRGAFTPAPGSDLEALAQNRISATPLKIDMTDRDRLGAVAAALG